MSIVLHHCVSARSFRPLWAMEELGLDYELRMHPFPPRVLERDFLAINSLGTVPLFIDRDTTMTESAAICDYLACRYGGGRMHVRPDEVDFGAYLNFLHFGEATLTFPQTLVLRYRHFEPEARKQPQVADDYARWFLARLKHLGPWLQAREFLCAGRFTAADISVGYSLLLAEHLGLLDGVTGSIVAYWQRLRSRPAFLRSQVVQHEAAIAQCVPTVHAPDLRAG